ncbi:alpha/beta hydrolase [Boudabousia marimammalium]|uniref:Alpha/beta hydrolase n=1 Tax=Boudabousia marimammalium TaxID=156892 RepID=A0A1Q5PSR5_9ACTO|nr:alpha/beta hydrolase [Boudabousia marimammalium]OKL50621.1 alpha/beta hydrolase [Boudabousia marimammalium]
MTEVDIMTPRGIRLSATLTEPVDARGSVVVFVHSFLSDRHSGGHFDKLAAAYRGAGYATLLFDFSGCGLSEDDAITAAHQVEDLRSVCSWLADRGYAHQIIHAHSFGAVIALKAKPPVGTMILSSPVVGPIFFDWNEIFSPEQLDDLESRRVTRIPDDSEGPREWFVITRDTLKDLSLNDTSELLSDLEAPVSIIFDADDMGLDSIGQAQEAFPLLPNGSTIHVEHACHFANLDECQSLLERSLAWATRHVSPALPKQRVKRS